MAHEVGARATAGMTPLENTMSTTSSVRDELKRRIDAIEGGYELMLAYAAQGLPATETTSDGQIRTALTGFSTALTGLADLYRDLIARERGDSTAAYDAFLAVLARDASAAQAAIGVVLAQGRISSLLVDNLNASIHVRALLTDVFVIDEALKYAAESSGAPQSG